MKRILIPALLFLLLARSFGFDESARREFSTDFSRSIVDRDEVRSGGPGKDGIPAIDTPVFVSVPEADEWIGDREPVLLLRIENEVKIYPLQILMWHEIVNDTIGSLPISVTYCPLCNSGIVFRRRLEGRRLDFGTTGRLRNSNLIMYDRQTESWWQQADGRAIAGTLAGSTLGQLPVLRSSWEQAKQAFPRARVLSRKTGFNRAYGRNPYRGYDDPGSAPFLYDGPSPPDRDAIERVLLVSAGGADTVIPYRELEQTRIRELELGGEALEVFYEAQAASALDKLTIAEGRAVGSANAFRTQVSGRSLHFRVRFGRITDVETGSRWNSLGEAVSGPLKGERLTPARAVDHFWFSAWSFFFRE